MRDFMGNGKALSAALVDVQQILIYNHRFPGENNLLFLSVPANADRFDSVCQKSDFIDVFARKGLINDIEPEFVCR